MKMAPPHTPVPLPCHFILIPPSGNREQADRSGDCVIYNLACLPCVGREDLTPHVDVQLLAGSYLLTLVLINS